MFFFFWFLHLQHPAPQDELAKALEYQSFTADTQDREDHTFSGIFFDVSASDELPLKYVEIHSLWVRGELGPLTVWSSPDGHGGGKVCDVDEWTKVYEHTHEPSYENFVELKLDQAITLHKGEKVGLYVHSKLPGDQAIVYDNNQHGSHGRKDDGKLVIWPGTAHLSNKPFGRRAPWGGDALRPRRQFVGRVGYAVRWLLWNPEVRTLLPRHILRQRNTDLASLLSSLRQQPAKISCCFRRVAVHV